MVVVRKTQQHVRRPLLYLHLRELLLRDGPQRLQDPRSFLRREGEGKILPRDKSREGLDKILPQEVRRVDNGGSRNGVDNGGGEHDVNNSGSTAFGSRNIFAIWVCCWEFVPDSLLLSLYRQKTAQKSGKNWY